MSTSVSNFRPTGAYLSPGIVEPRGVVYTAVDGQMYQACDAASTAVPTYADASTKELLSEGSVYGEPDTQEGFFAKLPRAGCCSAPKFVMPADAPMGANPLQYSNNWVAFTKQYIGDSFSGTKTTKTKQPVGCFPKQAARELATEVSASSMTAPQLTVPRGCCSRRSARSTTSQLFWHHRNSSRASHQNQLSHQSQLSMVGATYAQAHEEYLDRACAECNEKYFVYGSPSQESSSCCSHESASRSRTAAEKTSNHSSSRMSSGESSTSLSRSASPRAGSATRLRQKRGTSNDPESRSASPLDTADLSNADPRQPSVIVRVHPSGRVEVERPQLPELSEMTTSAA